MIPPATPKGYRYRANSDEIAGGHKEYGAATAAADDNEKASPSKEFYQKEQAPMGGGK